MKFTLPRHILIVKDALNVEDVFNVALFRCISGQIQNYTVTNKHYGVGLSETIKNKSDITCEVINGGQVFIAGKFTFDNAPERNTLKDTWEKYYNYLVSDALMYEMITETAIDAVTAISKNNYAMCDLAGVVSGALYIKGILSRYGGPINVITESAIEDCISIAHQVLSNMFGCWGSRCGVLSRNLKISPAYQYLKRYTPACADKSYFNEMAYKMKMTTVWQLSEHVACIGRVMIQDDVYIYSTLPPQVIRQASRAGIDHKLAIVVAPGYEYMNKRVNAIMTMIESTLGRAANTSH